jgi:hypothetical protein
MVRHRIWRVKRFWWKSRTRYYIVVAWLYLVTAIFIPIYWLGERRRNESGRLEFAVIIFWLCVLAVIIYLAVRRFE